MDVFIIYIYMSLYIYVYVYNILYVLYRAYHCIWVIAKHPDLKQLLGFAIIQLVAAQIISTSSLLQDFWYATICCPVSFWLNITSVRVKHNFQLLVFIMPLPQRSLRLSLLQATALLALGIPPIVTLGWNSGVVLTKPLLQWYKYITTKKSRNSSAAGEQTFIWRFLRNWCVIISLELYGV